MVIQNLNKNIDNSKKIIGELIKNMPQERNCACKDALKYAIMTDPKLISKEKKKKLSVLIGKYIK